MHHSSWLTFDDYFLEYWELVPDLITHPSYWSGSCNLSAYSWFKKRRVFLMLAEVSIFDLGLVFICSDASGSRESALRQIFKPDLLTRLNIRTVAMNACTTTNLGIINLFKYHTKLFPKCTISPRFFTSVFWTRRAEISSVVSNFDCSCTDPEPK